MSDVRRLPDAHAKQLRALGEDLVELREHLPTDGRVHRYNPATKSTVAAPRSADELLERRARQIPPSILARAAAGDVTARARITEALDRKE